MARNEKSKYYGILELLCFVSQEQSPRTDALPSPSWRVPACHGASPRGTLSNPRSKFPPAFTAPCKQCLWDPGHGAKCCFLEIVVLCNVAKRASFTVTDFLELMVNVLIEYD